MAAAPPVVVVRLIGFAPSEYLRPTYATTMLTTSTMKSPTTTTWSLLPHRPLRPMTSLEHGDTRGVALPGQVHARPATGAGHGHGHRGARRSCVGGRRCE